MRFSRSALRLCVRFFRSTDGATAIEYSIVAGMIAVAIIIGVTALSVRVGELYDAVASKVIVPT